MHPNFQVLGRVSSRIGGGQQSLFAGEKESEKQGSETGRLWKTSQLMGNEAIK